MKGFQDDTLDISDGVIFQVSYMAGGKQLYKDLVANGDNADLTKENINQFISRLPQELHIDTHGLLQSRGSEGVSGG